MNFFPQQTPLIYSISMAYSLLMIEHSFCSYIVSMYMCDVKVKRAKSMCKMLGIFIFVPQYIVRTVVSYACECCVSLYPGLISLVYPAQWAKTQKNLYMQSTRLFSLCIDVQKKNIKQFIHRFYPFYLYVAHMYLQGKNRKNSYENYRSPPYFSS